MAEEKLSIRQNFKNKNEDHYPIKVYFYDGTSNPEIVAKIKDKEKFNEIKFCEFRVFEIKKLLC